MTENLSPIARLASETQLAHREADGELQQLLDEPTAAGYRAWLGRELAFHAPVEAALEATHGLAGIVCARQRNKAASLRSDLAALGIDRDELASVANAHVPRRFASIPIALGWMYVAERATLQFHNAYRQLARALPGEIAFASSYLKCYEGTVGVKWREYVAAVEVTCNAPGDTAALIEAAREAFCRLISTRAASHACGASRRYAP